MLMEDAEMLSNQLRFSALKQGIKPNPITGEEFGKIFHEFPGVKLVEDGRVTEYNACDTSALFLIGHDYYKRISGNDDLRKQQEQNIWDAVEYIKSHLVNDTF